LLDEFSLEQSMAALILMYHDLAESISGIAPEHEPYVLAPDVFRSQMTAVATSRLSCLTATEWVTASPKPEHALVITFDDGHISNHDLALPIMLECGLKATFFITAGRIGTDETMNWEQIRHLHRAGMEIGSHTLTHRPPATLDDRELRYELTESRRILEDGLGAAVTSISSPTGFFNARMANIAREVGYRCLCIGRIGLARAHGDPFSLNRVAVKRYLSETQFRSLIGFDRSTLWSLRSRQWARDRARSILGVDSYLRIRKLLMRVDKVRGSKLEVRG
jgi:peptidoglycan/xylan/chitin deacetylase (PgdA/CDA1 family)